MFVFSSCRYWISEKYPKTCCYNLRQAPIIVCNHVSYFDALYFGARVLPAAVVRGRRADHPRQQTRTVADIGVYAGTGQVCGCELPYRRKHHQGDAGPCRDANASCVPCSSRVGCGLQPILVYRSKRTDGPKRKGALEQIMERVELAKTNPAFPPILIFPCVLALCCPITIGLNPHRIHIHTYTPTGREQPTTRRL